MNLDTCILQIQSYLEKSPLIVLGSGASAAFGLPTMADLHDELLAQIDDFNQNDEAVKDFFSDLNNGIDIETAIGMAHKLSSDEKNLIRKIVWEKVSRSDNEFF